MSLADFRGRPVVLVFYPADFTPVCTDQLSVYQDALGEFESRGVQLLGISVDSAFCHKAFQSHLSLTIPLLADFHPKGEVAKAYGVWSEDYGQAARALVLVGPDGTVEWSYEASAARVSAGRSDLSETRAFRNPRLRGILPLSTTGELDAEAGSRRRSGLGSAGGGMPGFGGGPAAQGRGRGECGRALVHGQQAERRLRLRAADGDDAGLRARSPRTCWPLRATGTSRSSRPTRGQVVAGLGLRAARVSSPEGYSVAGQKLVVQACRLSGSASSAGLSVQSTAIATTSVPKSEPRARLHADRARARTCSDSSGLDVTEHGGAGCVEVVLHGAADATKLVNNNFAYTVAVPDLAVQARNDRAADRAFAASTAASGSRAGGRPTGACSTTRDDMKLLARDAPRPGPADHAQPPDLRGPAGRGHRARDQPERPRRAAGLPAAGRAPRPRVAFGRARDRVGLRADQQATARATRAPSGCCRPRARSWSRSSTRTASTPRARPVSCS